MDGIQYIIEDNRERKRKELPELSYFKKKNYKILLADQKVKVNPDKLSVQDVDLSKINIDTKLFQNRRMHYSSESVQRILTAVQNNSFDWKLFDPILLFQDKKSKLWVLSGHSRFEAFKRLCKANNKEFCKIPAKIIKNISVEKAQEIAKKSNTLQTKETDTERANFYRELRQAKGTKKALTECKIAEGRNCSFIFRLSFLNPSGAAFQDYQAVEKSGAANAMLKSVVDWLGNARQKYTELTDTHEKELYTWLKSKYGRGQGLISSKAEFMERLNNIFSKFEKLPEHLNLVQYDTRSSFRKEYDKKMLDIEKELTKAKARLEAKRNDLIKRGATKEQLEKVLLNYNQDVNFWAENLIEAKNELAKYLQAEKKQTSLFGLGLNVEMFDLSNIKDLSDLKKEYRRLSLIYHPDRGGDLELMQQLNLEYDYLFDNLTSELNKEELNIEVEVDEKFRDIISQLADTHGVDIEIIGSWIWLSGATYPYRALIKSLGFKFAGKKKMWYWHAGEFKKKSKHTLTIDEIREKYKSQKIDKKGYQKKAIGAIEILQQNYGVKADYKGFAPTYKKVDYSSYIRRCRPSAVKSQTGDLQDTIKIIKFAINKNNCEVKELSNILQGATIEQTVFNIWHFLTPKSQGGQVNYKLDKAGVEEIRTPARTWQDRESGVDCEDMAIFAASILKNLNIDFRLKIVGFFGSQGYQHIFVEVPTGSGILILDPVMKAKFNELPKNIARDMKINYMSGIAGTGDPVISELEKMSGSQIAGIGAIDNETIQLAKDLYNLELLVEAQQNLYFANIEKIINNDPELGKFCGIKCLAEKARKEAERIANKLKKATEEALKKAKEALKKAKEEVKKGSKPVKKYGLAPVRGAFLLLVKVNFLGIAKKLYVGYLPTTQAKKLHLNTTQYNKAREIRVKVEKLFEQMGGKISALKTAVMSGRGQKKFEKGLKGIGLGEPVTIAAVTAAITAAAPILAPLLEWLSKMDFKALFDGLDKDDKDDKDNKDKKNKDNEDDEDDEDDNNKTKYLLYLIGAGAGIYFLTK